MYIDGKVKINNKMRDDVLKNNIAHGFLDRFITFEDFKEEVFGEFDEVFEELNLGRPLNEIREVKKESWIKIEGLSTEFADIIVFILDYCGRKGIDIDETLLTTPDKSYANPEYYDKVRKDFPVELGGHKKYFEMIRDDCYDKIGMAGLVAPMVDSSEPDAMFYKIANLLTEINEDTGKIETSQEYREKVANEAGADYTFISQQLHLVIKNIIQYCDIYEIDIASVLPKKIESNAQRPYKYKRGETVRQGKGLDYVKYLKELSEDEISAEFHKIKEDPQVAKRLRVLENLGYCPREIIEFELNRRLRLAALNEHNRKMGETLRDNHHGDSQPQN